MATVDQQEPAVHTNGSGNGNGKTIPVENPATGQTIGHVPDLSADQVADIVAKARAAQPAWDELGFDGRAAVMYKLRAWLVANRERMIKTIVDETGKTREDALVAEIMFVADSLGFWAKQRARSTSPTSACGRTRRCCSARRCSCATSRYGVVGVIGPWNYPLTNAFGDCIPALVAGNSVVLKPSEVTPLTSLLIEEGWKAVGGPRDVFQVATGRGETGAALVDRVDMIHVHRLDQDRQEDRRERAAGTLTPVSLELGGKDPMVVLRDADVERAANAAVYYGMTNGGQVCMSVERVYVEEQVYDEFVEQGRREGRARCARACPGEPARSTSARSRSRRRSTWSSAT